LRSARLDEERRAVSRSETQARAPFLSVPFFGRAKKGTRRAGAGAHAIVRMDGERISDTALVVSAGSSAVLQVGKRRFARVRIA